MTIKTSSPRSADDVLIDPPVARKPAIKAWAVLGAGFVVLQLYIYLKWITGPYFTPVPSGPTPVPMFMQVMVWIWIPGGIIAMLWCLNHFLIKPWRRDGRPNRDGLLIVGWVSTLWQDPLVSYFNNHLTAHLCGPDSGQLCPSSTMPVPKQGGVHFDQVGNLVVPPGVPAPGAGSVTRFGR